MAVDRVTVSELVIFVQNDADLNRQRETPIQRNLVNKMAAGKYNQKKAVIAFMHLADAGARKYTTDVAGGRDPGQSSFGIFSVAERRAAAEQFEQEFRTEARLGNFNDMLNKKNQRSLGVTQRGLDAA